MPKHRKQARKLGVVLGASAMALMISMTAPGEEAQQTETTAEACIQEATEAVAEPDTPQTEKTIPETEDIRQEEISTEEEPAEETEPPVQEETDPEENNPAEEETAEETVSRTTISAVSDDGVLEVRASKADNSGYPDSAGIKIIKKDAADKRAGMEKAIADRYRQEHADISWNETNNANLDIAVSASVRSFCVYSITDQDGDSLSTSDNDVLVTVKNTDIIKNQDGGCAATVLDARDMTQDDAATADINAEGHSFTLGTDTFVIAVLQDVSFTPETEAENELPEITGMAEAEDNQEQETGADSEENKDEDNSSMPDANAVEASAQTEPVKESPENKEENVPSEEKADTTGEDIKNEDAEDVPVHPEALDFDDRDRYPAENVDGPSPLDENKEDTGINDTSNTAPMSETTGADFDGLSNTEAAEKCLELVRNVDNSGIVPSVVTAQMILESGYVRTGLARNANNCFGMKSMLSQNEWPSTWGGTSINYSTWEQNPDGTITTPVCAFRVYDNIEQSILDHSGYLLGATKGGALRYPGVAQSRDYTEVAQIIKAGGYATDLNYVQKLCSIIQTYHLDRYDADVRSGTGTEGTVISQMR